VERNTIVQTETLRTRQTGRYSNCASKRQFESIRDAIQAADKYMDQITFTNGPMVPYHCPVHATWHIGHNKRIQHSSTMEYAVRCVQRERLREEISVLELLVQNSFYQMAEAA